jgi:hypothetical protein
MSDSDKFVQVTDSLVARIEAPMREARSSPHAHRGARVIGTDALPLVLILREPSDSKERKQDSEDDPNINAHQSSPATGPPMLVQAILFCTPRVACTCRGISSPAPSHAQVLERTSIKFAVHGQRGVDLRRVKAAAPVSSKSRRFAFENSVDIHAGGDRHPPGLVRS